MGGQQEPSETIILNKIIKCSLLSIVIQKIPLSNQLQAHLILYYKLDEINKRNKKVIKKSRKNDKVS